MTTNTSQRPIALGIFSLVVAGTSVLGLATATVLSVEAVSPIHSLPSLRGGTPDYAYARLVFTVAPGQTMAWINTPVGSAKATIGPGSEGSLAPIQDAIRATVPETGFEALCPGLPIDDMVLVQWMGYANWELVAVTQDQIDQGSTTSFFFKRLK